MLRHRLGTFPRPMAKQNSGRYAESPSSRGAGTPGGVSPVYPSINPCCGKHRKDPSFRCVLGDLPKWLAVGQEERMFCSSILVLPKWLCDLHVVFQGTDDAQGLLLMERFQDQFLEWFPRTCCFHQTLQHKTHRPRGQTSHIAEI